ncbi:MAG: class I SAM-dependent methyltransferase [Pseudodesulfovibrio sp.]|nr:class I SAM-dependent methyltransferase [Pseudodesulfovibrio sp.]
MTRIELINAICAHIRATDYLEIGIREGEVLSQVQVPGRTGVDPPPLLDRLKPPLSNGLVGVRVYPCESDPFFRQNQEQFDVIFVDGLHLYEQSIKDVLNALNCLRPGGYVVAHDLLPSSEAEGARKIKTGAWNGDVWKIMHDLHHNYADIHSFVVDSDFGLGVFWVNDPSVRFEPMWKKGYPRLPFSVYEEEKHIFMDIIPPDMGIILDRLKSRPPAPTTKSA